MSIKFKCEILSFDPSSQPVKYSLTQLFNRALAMTTATTRKTLLEKNPYKVVTILRLFLFYNVDQVL